MAPLRQLSFAIIKAMSKKTTKSQTSQILNRRARYDYELGDEIVAGLVLSGPEVKAARNSHVQLKGSYVAIDKDELWIHNASFSLKSNDRSDKDNRTVDLSPRKLLASRKQIDNLAAQKKSGMTIVPTKLLTGGRYIKLVIALGKGKKNYDKRQTIKKRDLAREQKI